MLVSFANFVETRHCLVSTAMRSARIFICPTDSSPEIYNVFGTVNAICKASVDLPMPGSPPSNIKLPGTIPPPRTLSISSTPVFVLATFWLCTSARVVVVAGFRMLSVICFLLSVTLISSFTLPHFPHSRQRPVHFWYWALQFEQVNMVVCLMGMFLFKKSNVARNEPVFH